jgi:putative transposase
MAGTYTALYYHLVFSTKGHDPWLTEEIQERVWPYLGGIARENSMTALQVGGTADHIHMLVSIPKTLTISHAVQMIKGGSSKWIHETIPGMEKFAWQEGYGAFTVSANGVEDTIAYIKNQAEHHRRRSFQEEYLAFLREYGITWDDRYIWK